MSPDEYCADKAARRGSSLFYAVLFLPPEKRRAIVAVHAFRREVEDIATECADPALGATKLQWWRNELSSVYRGVPQHPVARALQPSVNTFELTESPFQEIIDGVETDLGAPRFRDYEALARFCQQLGSVPNEIAAGILGYQHPTTIDRVRELGLATRMSRIIRDVGLDARRNRIYLPLEDLNRFSVSPADLLHRRHSEQFRSLIEFQIERVEGSLDRAFSRFPAADRNAQRPALALAAIGGALLREIRADGCRVLDGRTTLTPIRKLWIAWRAPRRHLTGRTEHT